VKHSARGVARQAREREKLAGHVSEAAPADPPRAAPAEPPWDAGPADPPMAVTPTAAAASGRRGRRWLAQLPYAVIVAGILAGLGLIRGGLQDLRGGTLVIAGALLAGSLTRLVLPEGRAGLLRSRRRLVDVAALTALGVGLLIAGLIVPVSA
jgi:DUF3017 family protein